MEIKELPIEILKLQNAQEPDQKLINSIKELGLLQPILVYETENQYEVVAGTRRLLACKYLGYKTIPCIVLKKNEYSIPLSENYNRSENIILAYHILSNLKDNKKLLKEKFGLSKSKISRILSIEKLIAEFYAMLEKNEIKPNVAFELATLNIQDQKDIFNKYVNKELKLTVKNIRSYKKQKPPKEILQEIADILETEQEYTKSKLEDIINYLKDIYLKEKDEDKKQKILKTIEILTEVNND
ncbi:MAG: ParB/RepB/Spo0J family partition protein [archaeon]